MDIMLMPWRNKEEKICYLVPKKNSSKILRNQKGADFAIKGKFLQIISQSETHTSIVMLSC
jgi:hypothetical protein